MLIGLKHPPRRHSRFSLACADVIFCVKTEKDGKYCTVWWDAETDFPDCTFFSIHANVCWFRT